VGVPTQFGLSMPISLRLPSSPRRASLRSIASCAVIRHCKELLDAAIAHTERCLALSYPRAVWYVRGAIGLENGQRRLARNPFRTCVHPGGLRDEILSGAGLRLSSRRETWMWSADVYVRA
jgi:hypothetical protein